MPKKIPHSHDCAPDNPLTTGQQATTIYIPGTGPQGIQGPTGPQGVGIQGIQGPSGASGVPINPSNIQFIYKLTTAEVVPATPTVNFAGEGWLSTIQSVTVVNRFQWVSFRYVSDTVTGAFSVPALYTIYSLSGASGSDGTSIEFIFKLATTSVTPVTPIDPSGVTNYTPTGWTINALGPNPTTAFEFFTKRTKVAGVWNPYDTPALWAKFSLDGVSGAAGKDVEFIFKRTQTDIAPATPIGNTAAANSFPMDWAANPVSVDNSFIWQWVSKRTNSGSVWTVYTAPILWNKFSVNGINGVDGADTEWIYKLSTVPVVPVTPLAADNITNNWVDTANGWTADPVGVTVLMTYEYTTQRRKVLGIWQPFSTPALWGKWSFDGNGIELIFKNTVLATPPPATPLTEQIDYYVPVGWAGNVTGVDLNTPHEFVSIRTKTRGIWSDYTPPRLWAKLGLKGDIINRIIHSKTNEELTITIERQDLTTASTLIKQSYIHRQQIASATWTIVHGLGKFPSVTVVDSGGSEIITEKSYVDNTRVVLVFSAAFSGEAFCN